MTLGGGERQEDADLSVLDPARRAEVLAMYADRLGSLLEESMLNQLAANEYGTLFDVGTVIVRFAQPQTLRSQHDQMPAGRSIDPDIAFFAKRNPGHAAGDELVCIADLNPANLSAAGWRIVYGAVR